MISSNSFKKGIAVLLATFPHLKPDEESQEYVLRFWKAAIDKNCDSDDQFQDAIGRFVLETPKLYPTDNWLAMLIDKLKPKIQETIGDITELIIDVISSVSFIYPNEATENKLQWLKEKSPISYAVGNRLGWRSMSECSDLGVLRGQIRAIAEAEIERANRIGQITLSAREFVQLFADSNQKLLIKEEKQNRPTDKQIAMLESVYDKVRYKNGVKK